MVGPGLAGPVCLNAMDCLSGGPPEGADVFAAELDGDGVLGDVDGYDLPGMDPAERDLLPDHHDDAGVTGPPLYRDRLGRRPWRPARRAWPPAPPGPGPRAPGGAGCP